MVTVFLYYTETDMRGIIMVKWVYFQIFAEDHTSRAHVCFCIFIPRGIDRGLVVRVMDSGL